jgi:hypothetical protein
LNSAVGAALGAIDFGCKRYCEFGAAWTRPAHVTVVKIKLHRGLTRFGVDESSLVADCPDEASN